MQIRLNTSIRQHLIIAATISLWLVVFLVVIAPFDVSELPFSIRLEIMPFYGVISFIGYVLVLPIQNWYFKKWDRWNWPEEIAFITLYNLIVFYGSYAYYQSDIINGNYSFGKFALEVYAPTLLLLLTTLIILRLFIFKSKTSQFVPKLELRGDNKYDVLQIPLTNLICISSADNYIEVNYLIGHKLHKKLLRTTLKTIAEEVPQLIKIHRSHLVNPEHIISWKDNHRLLLTQSELPVSRQFKKSVDDHFSRPS